MCAVLVHAPVLNADIAPQSMADLEAYQNSKARTGLYLRIPVAVLSGPQYVSQVNVLY